MERTRNCDRQQEITGLCHTLTSNNQYDSFMLSIPTRQLCQLNKDRIQISLTTDWQNTVGQYGSERHVGQCDNRETVLSDFIKVYINSI